MFDLCLSRLFGWVHRFRKSFHMTVFRSGSVFVDKPTFSYLRGCALLSINTKKRVIVCEPSDGGMHFDRNLLGGWSKFSPYLVNRLLPSGCEQVDFVGYVSKDSIVFVAK